MAEQVPVKGLDVAQVPQKYLIFPCVIDDEQKRVWFCLPTGQEFIHLGLETDVLKRLYDVVGCLVLVALQTVLGQCGDCLLYTSGEQCGEHHGGQQDGENGHQIAAFAAPKGAGGERS